MHRAEEHIVALVQDALRAIAGMHVDIQHRRLGAATYQHLRRDRRIVQIAEPARQIGVGVMSGWPAQRIGLARAAEDALRALHRDMCRRLRRVPRRRQHRHALTAEVIARLPHDRVRPPLHRPHRIAERAHHGTCQRRGLPALERGLQELEIPRVVHRRDRRHPVIRRRCRRQAQPVHRAQQLVDARRPIVEWPPTR